MIGLKRSQNILNLGFLVEENENYIIVAQILGIEPEQYCQIMCIPQKAITHLITLDEKLHDEDGYGIDPNEPGRYENPTIINGKHHNLSFIE